MPASPAVAAVDLAVGDESSNPTDAHYVAPTTGGSIDPFVTNDGTATQIPRLTIALPAGWRAEQGYDSGYPSGTCATSGSSFVCTLPAIDPGQSLNIGLVVYPPAGAALGSTSLPIHVDPVSGVDSDPSDNDASYNMVNIGDSVLKTTITQSATTVGVNGEVSFTVVVTNNGPATTVGLDVAVSASRATTMDGFLQLPPTGPGVINQGGGDPPHAGSDYDWQPGELAAGQSVTLHVTWRALVLGAVGQLEVGAESQPEVNTGTAFVPTLSQSITVGTVATSATSTASTSSTAALADTGPSHGPLLVVAGLLMLAFGGLLTTTGRRVALRRH